MIRFSICEKTRDFIETKEREQEKNLEKTFKNQVRSPKNSRQKIKTMHPFSDFKYFSFSILFHLFLLSSLTFFSLIFSLNIFFESQEISQKNSPDNPPDNPPDNSPDNLPLQNIQIISANLISQPINTNTSSNTSSNTSPSTSTSNYSNTNKTLKTKPKPAPTLITQPFINQSTAPSEKTLTQFFQILETQINQILDSQVLNLSQGQHIQLKLLLQLEINSGKIIQAHIIQTQDFSLNRQIHPQTIQHLQALILALPSIQKPSISGILNTQIPIQINI